MRVVLVGDFPPPHGGISVHVAQLWRWLGRQGVDARVLDIGKGRALREQGGAIEGVQGPAELVRRLLRHAREGALIHLHTSGNNAKSWTVAAAVGAVARAEGAPAVITVHSGLLQGLLAESNALRLLARTALAPYAHVIAVSPSVRDALLRAGLEASVLSVCPAFIPGEVRPAELSLELHAALRPLRPLLACAHHPSPVYGLELMLEALALLRRQEPSMGLALFGPEADGPLAHAAARRHGVDDAVAFLGELEHAQTLAVMRRANVFVRPTTADGDSVSVREALVLGTPCVASDAAARPEGVRTFPVGNPEALAAEIREALGTGRELPPQPDAGEALLAVYRRLAATRRGWSGQVEGAASA